MKKTLLFLIISLPTYIATATQNITVSNVANWACTNNGTVTAAKVTLNQSSLANHSLRSAVDFTVKSCGDCTEITCRLIK